MRIKAQKELLKKKMLASVPGQSKTAEIANIGIGFGQNKSSGKHPF